MKAVNREKTLRQCLTEAHFWLTIYYTHLGGNLNTATFFK